VLEFGYRDGAQELRNVIMVSFLEQLPGFAGRPPGPMGIGAKVRNGLGPTLKAVLFDLEQWRAGDAPAAG